MSLNQFNNQLGYFQGVMAEENTFTPDLANEWFAITPDLTDDTNFQYNTDIVSNKIHLSIKGIWKFSMSCTFNGSVNDDMQFCIGTAYNTTKLPPVKWNQRGGNNWAISYSLIFKTLAPTDLDMFIKNEDVAEENIKISRGIFTAIKLY